MSEELKPCPFCGGEAYLFHVPRVFESYTLYKFIVRCQDCGAEILRAGRDFNIARDAIQAWNVRAYDEHLAPSS